ncbi:HAD-IA family hydrolase [Streptomyces sp. WMMB303]|uniref:HAD family hydrolase n=1 Tax=Streptomyces sp. WMMB303 TaxID=3034154 RepID=UPI0023EB0EA3|nr:HAD-IA family hydrolase [Streptomyces sp. WMMB303]MDF4251741.1 HAD-IA family hydrolase [Streptomyces sp. WMMB303]
MSAVPGAPGRPREGERLPGVVLFDFDGLLCDTEAAGHRAWCELYAEHGRTFPDRTWREMVGREDGELLALRRLLAGEPDQADDAAYAGGGTTARAAELLARRRWRKRELCTREPLRPGARELLQEAARTGVPAAVVSSGPAAWVFGHLERLAVRELFALLVTGDQVRRPKPHPEPYLLALRRLGCRAAEAVAFEDSTVGVRAARAAGVWCVAVDNAAGGPADLSEADVVLDSLADYRLTAPFGGVGHETSEGFAV